MNPKDQLLLEELIQTRDLSRNSIKNYKQAIKNYTESQQGKTLTELLEEADQEEEEGIRLKNRTLKKRLITFRNYLIQNKGLSESTVNKNISLVKTIYNNYEIEIPRIPKNNRHIRNNSPIYYDDLPTKELIQEAIKISTPNMKAVILFIVSSGCAREETLSLTIQDFIDSTKEYHNSTNIYDVLEELKGQGNVVPIFKMKRKKVNKYYYTFCSPEAVDAIVHYLEYRTDLLTPEKQLFKFDKAYLIRKFIHLNESLGGQKKGGYGIFRSHMLRKFHASNLARGENGLTVEEIDSLQGRGKNKTHTSYFLDDPKELRKKYISNIDKVLINTDVMTLTFESPEVLEIRKENEKLKEENARIKEEITHAVNTRIQEVFDEFGIDEILNKHGL